MRFLFRDDVQLYVHARVKRHTEGVIILTDSVFITTRVFNVSNQF